jgi:hypothetical protein
VELIVYLKHVRRTRRPVCTVIADSHRFRDTFGADSLYRSFSKDGRVPGEMRPDHRSRRGDVPVHRARFIVLSVGNRSSTYGSDEHDTTISWLLVSPNNRPLGRGCTTFDTYEACRAAVHRLREWATPTTSTVTVADANRQ